ncbi:MAG: hypothetical protein GY780_13880 [bacterium]|nr:hypothetical protein [bacterium]
MKLFASALSGTNSGTHARWFRLSVAPIFVLFILGLGLLSTGCSDDSEDVTFPTPPSPDEMNWLFDVYGVAADDVYACGNKGAMFHYDGVEWSFVEMGTGSPITTIWGPGDGTLYAAGHDGNLWQLSGSSWSTLNSGTSEDLYGLGIHNSSIHACGANGTLRQLEGSSWNGYGSVMVTRTGNLPSDAPKDTLDMAQDIPALLTLNEYFIGGAFKDPDFDGEYIGVAGTDGMVMLADIETDLDGNSLYDWWVRLIGNDQFAIAEWAMCTTSNPVEISSNYLGTSEGWLYQLNEDLGTGNKSWVVVDPDITIDSNSGIRDMWQDENNNLYMVTDDGEMIFQTANYDFVEEIGQRKAFEVTHSGLTSIWGSDSDNLFMTGFTENSLIQASMDFSDTTLVFTQVPIEFPNKAASGIGLFEDHVGMPRMPR